MLGKSIGNITGKNIHSQFDEIGIKLLSWFSKDERELRLRTYFKFLVVRQPFERLVSAYRDKIETLKGFFEPIQEQEHVKNITFETFVNYIIHEHEKHHCDALSSDIGTNVRRLRLKGHLYLNPHWAQYTTLCHPCHIDYDYIVKFETMREDAAYVLSKFGPRDECPEETNPELFVRSKPSSLRLYEKFLAKLTISQLKKLREIFSIDFKLFDY